MSPPVALVTGANRGIGWCTARALARRGFFIILGCRDQSRGQHALADLGRLGFDGTMIALDVADPAQIDGAVATVEQLYGRLDVLVNNAGVFYDVEDRTLADLSWQTLDRLVRINLCGPLWLARACLPLLFRTAGRIVNVTSDMARFDMTDGAYSGYRITKAGLDMLTANLATQLRESGVLVNAVDPGWVRTDMGGTGAPGDANEAAALITWAATLPHGGPSGKVFCLAKDFPDQAPGATPLIPVRLGDDRDKVLQ